MVVASLGVDEQTAQATWWDLGFWNKRVTQTRYLFGTRERYAAQAFPEQLFIRPRDGRVSGLGESQYMVRAVADRRFGLAGESRVGDPHNNLQLWAVRPPVRASWVYLGPDDTGFLPPGSKAFVRVFAGARGGPQRVAVTLGAPFDARAPARYAIAARGGAKIAGQVAVGRTATPRLTVSLPPFGHADLLVRARAGGGSPGLRFYGATASSTT